MSAAVVPLPSGLKRTTIGALVLAALLGFGAVRGLTELFTPPEEADFSKLDLPPQYREALKAVALAQLAAYEGMRGSRTVILLGMWALSAFTFVAALRMLRPQGVPREGVRRVLSSALLLTAVMRTLDGAQEAAVVRKAGRALDEVLQQPDFSGPLWATSVGVSFIVGGCLLMMSRYYRSERVRDVCAGLDSPRP